MASPAPAPVPSTGTGRGGTGRLSSLPTPVKVGGAVVIAAVAFFLWRRHKTNAAANAAASAPSGATLPTQDYGFAPGGLAPSLLGYNPTGQITGYDVNGNPIYGVTPPSSPTTPSPTNPGSTGGGTGSLPPGSQTQPPTPPLTGIPPSITPGTITTGPQGPTLTGPITLSQFQQGLAQQGQANVANGVSYTPYPSAFVDTHGNVWPNQSAWEAAGKP